MEGITQSSCVQLIPGTKTQTYESYMRYQTTTLINCLQKRENPRIFKSKITVESNADLDLYFPFSYNNT